MWFDKQIVVIMMSETCFFLFILAAAANVCILSVQLFSSTLIHWRGLEIQMTQPCVKLIKLQSEGSTIL
jgi:hypothetical protein